jgi:methionyl-tRNA formyltransferase
MTHADIVCSDPRHPVNAWLDRWARRRRDHHQDQVQVHRNTSTLPGGDFLFLVSCQQIVRPATRALYRHTLVLHASALPAGRGMSPHIWQLLEGQAGFTLSLLDAEDALDTGRIWQQTEVAVPPTALFDEINARLFDAEIALMDWALAHCGSARPREQTGTPSLYRKRVPADSRIEATQTLAEVFDQLRVADPERYPAFFEHRGQAYRIRIDKL